MCTYPSELYCSQFRGFSFAIALFGNMGCLLCSDYSGVVYTKTFNWVNEPDTFLSSSGGSQMSNVVMTPLPPLCHCPFQQYGLSALLGL